MRTTIADISFTGVFYAILIGVCASGAVVFARSTEFVLVAWILGVCLFILCTYPSVISPVGLVLHRTKYELITDGRELIIQRLLSEHGLTCRNLSVIVVDDRTINVSIIHTWTNTILLITSGYVNKLTGTHMQTTLGYIARIVQDSKPLFHSTVVLFAVLCEKSILLSFVGASLLHSLTREIDVYNADTYVSSNKISAELHKQVLQAAFNSMSDISVLPASLSPLSLVDVSHGPHTYESNYCSHPPEHERIDLINNLIKNG